MKRVVAITVMMVIVTTLFAFSVYADTPVQPLQVITYSDTTTNVRISGTAERLHYNIDSFQVVFMNPPNNYGTACTPVLVSFRFYNASDLPAYVGQPEFELTATTSTGNVNTIIYGYDQISTDLFVAESSYSTAEVGRIGIGASNDFAYYTGFVIPPRTSLYFSCIIYVNASAYAQNNTGATEDVNQVTLSTLNMYSNQISFSADYPYHNQPVDFTDIIQAITDLSDTVSTSSEMSAVIDLLTYSGQNYNPSIPSFTAYSTVLYSNNNLDIRVSRYIGQGRLVNTDFEIDASNDSTMSSTQYVYPVLITLQTIPRGGRTFIMPNEFRVNGVFPYGSAYLEQQYSNVADIVNYANYVAFNWKIKYNGYQSIVPYKQQTSLYVFNCYFTNPSSATWSDLSITSIDSSYPIVTNEYFPFNEYDILRDLYKSLVKDSNQDNTEEAQDMNDDIHDAEQVWFDNNSQALEEVGLSNYRFSQSQSNGITQAVTQFQAVWNALGDWTNVYIFILILSISTYIIRHEPTTRVKQYRSSVQAERAERISYYGRKNAESRANSGSTLKSVIRRRK